MQAVIKIGSTQHLVEPGQEILIDHLSRPEKSLTFSEVLLLIDGSDVSVGQPFVTNASVTATYLDDKRGEKIRVAKFKAKSRYRKATGFRADYSRIRIENISTTPAQPVTSDKSMPEKPVRKPRSKKSV